MNYLFVCATFFDQGGFAMVQGARNGIGRADPEADFGAMLRPEGYADKEDFFWVFNYPAERMAAYGWADVILDVGGITVQNAYRTWLVKEANRQGKPYVFMPQSCIKADPWLFEDTTYIARGERSARTYKEITGRQPALIAPDLSFLVAPSDQAAWARRVFVTHLNKPYQPMIHFVDLAADAQLMFKEPRDGKAWEPMLHSEMPVLTGSPENLFGVIGKAKEVHTARYQAACAAILQDVSCQVYVPDSPKYEDLADMAKNDPGILKAQAQEACDLAVRVAKRHGTERRSGTAA